MLSVLIATHNGEDTIDRTLAAMSALEVPPEGWQLIVVNNASTDGTEARIKAWRGRLPLEYLEEERLGKSTAMNKALRHAAGDFIVMTDDDVLPDRNWLTQWRRVADAFPQCSIFGGAIVPEFEEAAPPFYVPRDCFGVLYGLSPDYGEGELAPSRENGLFEISGGNFAIRKAVYDEGHQLAENFLRGANGLMGEDTEFVRRLASSRYKACFTPNARVRHIIHKRQTSWGWIHKRLFRHGHTLFFLMHVRPDMQSGQVRFAFPWSRLRSAPGSFLRLLIASLRLDKEDAFKQSHGLAYDLGALAEAFHLRWRGPLRRE